jgi:hypothetical protein
MQELKEPSFHFLPHCPACNKPLPWITAFHMDKHMITCKYCDARLIQQKLKEKQMRFWQQMLYAFVKYGSFFVACFLLAWINIINQKGDVLSDATLTMIYSSLIAFGLLAGLILHLLSHRYAIRKPKCRHCDYSLAEIASDACPECGWAFDRDSAWFKGTDKYDQYPGLPVSCKWTLIFAVCLLLLSTLGSLAYSQLTRGYLDEIGLPFSFYGSFSRNTFNRAWNWELMLADIAACVFLGFVVEYLRQWFIQRNHQRP